MEVKKYQYIKRLKRIFESKYFFFKSLIGVSEWLLFNTTSAIFHGENKLIFNEMIMKSALF
jgi:hypothetical protein